MKNNKGFGNCLSELLKIFNLKGSRLARGINVDSSLIYKWLRNERVPSYNSTYIDLITNFFINNISNSFQKEIVVEALRKWSLEELATEDISIEEAIRTYLKEAQGYSIELLSKENNKKRQAKSLSKDMLSSGIDFVNIITGEDGVLQSALDILENIPKYPEGKDDTILITLNSNMDILDNFKEFNIKWKKVLHKILKNGWKIVYLVKLNNNIKRTIKIIEYMQLSLYTGRYDIYYYKDSSLGFMGNELIVVPNVGALYCFSSKLKNQVDSAFLFKSKESIEILSGHFFQLFSSAKPLLKSYNWQKTTQLHHTFIEAEETLGDKYVFKGDINTITLPLDLYKKYLKLTKKTNEEIKEHLFLHKRRLDAFEAQIKYYKFKDIFFKESIENLVKEKIYSFDPYFILDDITLDYNDIKCHLENIINMLEKYENYEIALVNKKDFENISKICWMVKENNGVFIQKLNDNIISPYSSYNCNENVDLLISEAEVVDAFIRYFLSMWSSLPSANKDKKKVIKWIKSQIELLKV
ncbi:hypothetical protein CLHOM_13400 [Clostridium homopropionicum DSM 5847]|uniref:Uncharacterized protein n=1 Tax=Clostridium homopropionicum DSM 5847 TaxID=1121318 RepID=A0A0L6ZAZ1_9CLOT|nr:hypothetical protein [Clostridium homopropionicum]KOA20144.1 hypothetical protein CLHOM_13400 [Clostridium homopropionicum DSM 5847]SFG61479.1 hypothetical protein SAMN04488501_111136 [Clostridium homopropionicum]